MVLTSLKISETRNVLNVTSTWYNIVMSHHGGGTWHNALFLTKASNVTCWADGANNVPRLWQAGKMENFEWRFMGRIIPDSKVHGASMGPIWGRQDPGGPHDGPMNFAIWDGLKLPNHRIKLK